jgi:hypothetical protein
MFELIIETVGFVMIVFAIVNHEPLWSISGAILFHAAITHYRTNIDKKIRLSVLDGVTKFLENMGD